MNKKTGIEPLSEEMVSQLPADIRELVYNKETGKLLSPKKIITNLSTHIKFQNIRKIRGGTDYLIYNGEKKVYDQVNYISLKDFFNGYLHSWKIHRYCSNRFLKEFYEILKDAFPPIERDEIDPKHLILFKDCIFDVDEQKILPLTPEKYITNTVGYDLNSSTEEYQETRKFLEDLADGHEDRVEYAEAIIAYVLFQMRGKQYIFHLYGKGGTGKSTFTNYISSLVGLHATTTTTPEKLGAERFETATLKGKSLVLINDRKGSSFDIEKLKSISGGDIVAAEQKYKQDKEIFVPDPAIIFSTNESVRLLDPSGAIKRRYMPFLMNNVVQKQKMLLDCKGTHWVGPLAEERSAFVSYVLKKWNQEKVFHLFDSLNTTVPSLSKELFSLRESFNPLVGYVRNYLEQCDFSENALPLGLTTKHRKNNYSKDEVVFSPDNNNLVSGAVDYFKRLDEEFPYNHKTYKESFISALKENGIKYEEIKRSNLTIFQGIKWRDGVFDLDLELDMGTEKPVKEEFMDDLMCNDQLKFLKESNNLKLKSPYLGEKDLMLNETFFKEFNSFLENLENSYYFSFLKQNTEDEWRSQKLVFLLSMPNIYDRALWRSYRPEFFRFTFDFSEEKGFSTMLLTEIIFVDFMFTRAPLDPNLWYGINTLYETYKDFVLLDKEKIKDYLKQLYPLMDIPENLNVMYDLKDFRAKLYFNLSLSSPEKSFLFLNQEKTEFRNKMWRHLCVPISFPCSRDRNSRH
jgi:P4 family phage/plasmid primase-like protien